ncbi:hypothetical protein KJ680_10980 [bacterium]|nr:hypothetical protein [bacterium]
MRKQIVNTFFSIVTVAMFMVGCGGSSSAVPTKVATISETVLDDNTIFIEGGTTILKDVDFNTTSDDGTVLANIKIAKDTEFKDANGVAVTTAPKLVLNTTQATSTTTTLSFKDVNGNRLTPTKPVTLTLAAPAGSKDGDQVQVDAPDTVTVGKQEKLTLVIVKNGVIVLTLSSEAFLPGQDVTITITIVEKTGAQ